MAAATRDDVTLDALDFAPRCEWRLEGGAPRCEVNAAWAMLSSCGDSAAFCAPHKERMATQLGSEPVYCSRHPEAGRVLIDWAPL